MNRVGDGVEAVMLRDFKPDALARAREIVQACDVVDRHLDPVARIEFGDTGREAERDPLATYLKSAGAARASIPAALLWPTVFEAVDRAIPFALSERDDKQRVPVVRRL